MKLWDIAMASNNVLVSLRFVPVIYSNKKRLGDIFLVRYDFDTTIYFKWLYLEGFGGRPSGKS